MIRRAPKLLARAGNINAIRWFSGRNPSVRDFRSCYQSEQARPIERGPAALDRVAFLAKPAETFGADKQNWEQTHAQSHGHASRGGDSIRGRARLESRGRKLGRGRESGGYGEEFHPDHQNRLRRTGRQLPGGTALGVRPGWALLVRSLLSGPTARGL